MSSAIFTMTTDTSAGSNFNLGPGNIYNATMYIDGISQTPQVSFTVGSGNPATSATSSSILLEIGNHEYAFKFNNDQFGSSLTVVKPNSSTGSFMGLQMPLTVNVPSSPTSEMMVYGLTCSTCFDNLVHPLTINTAATFTLTPMTGSRFNSTLVNQQINTTMYINSAIGTSIIFTIQSTNLANANTFLATGTNNYAFKFDNNQFGSSDPIVLPSSGGIFDPLTLTVNVPSTSSTKLGYNTGNTCSTCYDNIGAPLIVNGGCIHENSLIITSNGPKKIKDINAKEDKVLTPDNSFIKVLNVVPCWIQPPGFPIHDCIVFEINALGDNEPSEKLIIDPGHYMCTIAEYKKNGLDALKKAGEFMDPDNKLIYESTWADMNVNTGQNEYCRYDIVLEEPHKVYMANNIVIKSRKSVYEAGYLHKYGKYN